MCRRERFGRSLRSEVQDRTFSMGTMRCSDRMSDARFDCGSITSAKSSSWATSDLGRTIEDQVQGSVICDSGREASRNAPASRPPSGATYDATLARSSVGSELRLTLKAIGSVGQLLSRPASRQRTLLKRLERCDRSGSVCTASASAARASRRTWSDRLGHPEGVRWPPEVD